MRSSGRRRFAQKDATPSRRPQKPSAPTTPGSTTQRLNGQFSNGTWYCNCDPRDEAVLQRVARSKDNLGKLYWSCDRNRNDPLRCNFFLWETEARARSGVDDVPSATATEKAPPVEPVTPARAATKSQPGTARPDATQMPTPSTRASTTKVSRNRPIRDFFPPTANQVSISSGEDEDQAQGDAQDLADKLPVSSSSTMVPQTPPTTRTKRERVELDEDTARTKRKRVEFDEDLIGDLSSDEERLMNEAFERSTRKLQLASVDDAAAPAAAPFTPTARTLFPEARRARIETPTTEAVDTESAGSGLTIQRSRHGEDNGVLDEVMGLLKGQPLEESVRKSIMLALERQAAQYRGAVMGRDTVRKQIKAKEERISQLQERVAALENKSKMQRQELTEIKAGLANLYSKH